MNEIILFNQLKKKFVNTFSLLLMDSKESKTIEDIENVFDSLDVDFEHLGKAIKRYLGRTQS